MDEARAHLRAVALAVAGMMLLLMVLKRSARRRGLATLGQSPLRRRRERDVAVRASVPPEAPGPLAPAAPAPGPHGAATDALAARAEPAAEPTAEAPR
jgi:hypothetical protein